MDETLQALKRRLHTDPSNKELERAYLHSRARLEGGSVYLEALSCSHQWNLSSPEIQNLAINEVNSRLGALFKHERTALYTCGENSHRIASFRHKPSQLLVQLIPGGRYEMGWDDELAYHRESPVHTVTIPPFLMGQFPVRQSCWATSSLPNNARFRGPDHPIERVSFGEVQAFLDHFHWRLPSEAEWEYACRSSATASGNHSEFYWGEEFDEAYCWHDNNCQSTMPVTEHKAQCNSFGLVDMIGNVWEWCADHYQASYDEARSDQHPYLIEQSRPSWAQAIRGASWTYPRAFCRSSFRFPRQTISKSADLGFRVALDIPKELKANSS
ncbi:MAG: formylglycine-generating enzyme family protein [Planctomycetota bacterium]|nr:formylglycine-generating enzyme family protein [Planctomycetota bacterium]